MGNTPSGDAFIGQEALQHIAEKYYTKIIMGAAYYRASEFSRLRIRVSTGLQFKDTIQVFNRKGGLTRRKYVGAVKTVDKIGYVEERTLTGYQSVLRARDNKDNYLESPSYTVNGDATPYYPASEEAFLAVTQTYGEDNFRPLFHGDAESTDEHLNLYDGFHTDIAKDVAKGNISKERGNLIELDAITEPTEADPTGAYRIARKFYLSLPVNMQNAPEIDIHCSILSGEYIAQAYKNNWKSQKDVNRITEGDDAGNFTINEMPRVIFIPSSEFGVGDLLVATVPQNLEYGVNSLDSKSKIDIKYGSDDDNDDIFIQIQGIQGTRIRRVTKDSFVMSTGTIKEGEVAAGDYTQEKLTVTSNDSKMGTAVIGTTNKTENDVYAKGVILTLTATPAEGYEFVRWSDSNTNATRAYVTKGIPDAVMAIFKAKA